MNLGKHLPVNRLVVNIKIETRCWELLWGKVVGHSSCVFPISFFLEEVPLGNAKIQNINMCPRGWGQQ